MRISLLIQREPFYEILCRTLTNYWRMSGEGEYLISWGKKGKPAAGSQKWLANHLINAIFTPESRADNFEPIVREFSYSLKAWRRPIQSAYVNCAITPMLSSRLAHEVVWIQPALNHAADLIIVAGNHKIRLLNRRTMQSTSIIKDGFSPRYMESEVNGRQWAAKAGLKVPAILSFGEDFRWLKEDYLSGTPLNRLANQDQADRSLRTVLSSIQSMGNMTRVEIGTSVYLETILEKIIRLTTSNHLLSEANKQEILSASQNLADKTLGLGIETIDTCLTHGDFQPANLLVDGADTWLIDWEYSGQRSCWYDQFVFGLGARHPQGLAKRAMEFQQTGFNAVLPELSVRDPNANAQSPLERQFRVGVFFLEELLLRLEENNCQQFFTAETSLFNLLKEIFSLQL